MPSKDLLLYSKTTGINYNSRPEDMLWDGSGLCELVDAQNIRIDKIGTIHRAPGYEFLSQFDTPPHTVFDDTSRIFVGEGTKLYVKAIDGGLTLLKGDCSGQPLAITVYADNAYCSDGVSCFIVKPTGEVTPWTFVRKAGAKSTKEYSGPLPHSRSFTAFGRIFILCDGVVFFTDPLAPTMFNFAENFLWDQAGIVDCYGINGVVVVGTSKYVYTLTSDGDFSNIKRTVISHEPMVPNTFAEGFLKKERVLCFTMQDSMCAISATSQKPVQLTENRVPFNFFADGKSFIGAGICNERYSIFGNNLTDTYTVDLETKGLERHTLKYLKVHGRYGVLTSNTLVKREVGKLLDLSLISFVKFQAAHFNVTRQKKIRRLSVRGVFTKQVRWTITDDFGTESSVTKDENFGTPRARGYTVPGANTVSGQLLTVSFSTPGDFSLSELHVLPIVEVTRRL